MPQLPEEIFVNLQPTGFNVRVQRLFESEPPPGHPPNPDIEPLRYGDVISAGELVGDALEQGDSVLYSSEHAFSDGPTDIVPYRDVVGKYTPQ